MSELHNPLFEDQREFLERQKEEYKNALLSEVADLKDQSTKIGKNLLIAGGLLGGIYLLSRALNGGSKGEKQKKKRLKSSAKFKGAEDRAWISSIPEVEDDEPLYSAIERTYPAVYHPATGTVVTSAPAARENTSMWKSFFQSDLFKIIEQQATALLMVYISKLIEQHLQGPATPPALASASTDPEYVLQPDDADLNAQPSQS